MNDDYEIITELSEDMKLRMEIVEDLMEKCDRKTYSKKLNLSYFERVREAIGSLYC